MTNNYIQDLRLSLALRESVIRKMIRALKLQPGSRGLDAGCGIGDPTFRLAEVVGPHGHVTGLDPAPELLDHAAKTAEKTGFARQVAFQAGDANHLPFDDDVFDWGVSIDCVGYASQAPFSAIRELKRVVKPGGKVAVCFWSSQQLLPGYPELEARLNATARGIAPFTRNARPESHPLRAMGGFREAGLENVKARTFAGDICSPPGGAIRDALISLIRMRWGDPAPELDRNDQLLYRRICSPESSDFIIDCPDYYGFFTYSLFTGDVP